MSTGRRPEEGGLVCGWNLGMESDGHTVQDHVKDNVDLDTACSTNEVQCVPVGQRVRPHPAKVVLDVAGDGGYRVHRLAKVSIHREQCSG